MKIFALKRWTGGLAGLGILCLVLFLPAQSAAGVLAGLNCCTNQVIPALFPFFIVSSLIVASPLAEWLGLLVWPAARFCLGLKERKASTALLICWLGGFAVAASTISQLYKQGQLTRRQAQLLLVCGVGSGPAFVMNTVGMLMLGSLRLGVCLFVALLCANVGGGLFMRLILPRETAPAAAGPAPEPEAQAGFVQAVRGAVQSMLVVCGFVVFFRFLSATLGTLLPRGGVWLSALLEVTTGCAAAAALPGGPAVLACAAALSIQSLSVLLQVRALLCRELSLGPLLAVRPLHLGLTLCFLQLFLRLLPGDAAVFTTLAPKVIAQSRTAPDAALVLFLLCCLVLRSTAFTAGGQSGIIKRRHIIKHRKGV